MNLFTLQFYFPIGLRTVEHVKILINFRFGPSFGPEDYRSSHEKSRKGSKIDLPPIFTFKNPGWDLEDLVFETPSL